MEAQPVAQGVQMTEPAIPPKAAAVPQQPQQSHPLIEVIRELTGFTGQACLVRRGDEHFVVSSVVAPYTGAETLVFPADADGEVADWIDVAGGRGVSREEAIAELGGAS
jgi:hypothetical protein